MRATITVRNIDTKLFKKQRFALDRIMGELEQSWIGLKLPVPKHIASDMKLVDGLVNMMDNMADTIDGLVK
jgi:hypothetical protein